MRCDLPIAESCDHRVICLGDILGVLEDIEVRVLDVLIFSSFFADGDVFGILFRALDRLEELPPCI
ncbi:hypothetical protein [Haladaptatus litoreus]|uniref:hypothetical protein n=1 Tax=Haladaptatus litoreus TaxID=553468 RepID=UPI00158B4549|nr:hypothetical protein [Haladaptatus litoreus]